MNKAAKITVWTALMLVSILVFAAPALAIYTAQPEWTHGNYTNNTNACASCHVTHAAPYSKLLVQGPTITQFCYLCHGQGAPGAPYDIQLGRTMAYDSAFNRTVWYPSTAGGFEGLMAPDAGVDYSVYGTAINSVTARHNVSGYVNETGGLDQNDLLGDSFIPGGLAGLTYNGLECTSCHDPHGGGPYPDYVVNARLLRRALQVGETVYQSLYMEIGMSWLGTTTVNQYAYRVIAYNNSDSYPYRRDLYYSSARYDTGSNSWCSACHVKFNTRTPSGRTPDAWGMYRHAMNVPAPAAFFVTGTPDQGTPLEVVKINDTGSTIRKVACLTCHRAHATTVTTTGVASWPRSEGGYGTSSALLRMNYRDVCYNCHGAAQRNTTSSSVYQHDSGWTANDCWTCHST